MKSYEVSPKNLGERPLPSLPPNEAPVFDIDKSIVYLMYNECIDDKIVFINLDYISNIVLPKNIAKKIIVMIVSSW